MYVCSACIFCLKESESWIDETLNRSHDTQRSVRPTYHFIRVRYTSFFFFSLLEMRFSIIYMYVCSACIFCLKEAESMKRWTVWTRDHMTLKEVWHKEVWHLPTCDTIPTTYVPTKKYDVRLTSVDTALSSQLASCFKKHIAAAVVVVECCCEVVEWVLTWFRLECGQCGSLSLSLSLSLSHNNHHTHKNC